MERVFYVPTGGIIPGGGYAWPVGGAITKNQNSVLPSIGLTLEDIRG